VGEDKGSKKVREWLESTVRLMVDQPDKVRVEEVLSPDEGTSYFSIYVQYEDQGKVVGRGGANINAVRKIAYAMALARYKRRCEVTVHDQNRSRRNDRG